jgi:hypothetical protein
MKKNKRLIKIIVISILIITGIFVFIKIQNKKELPNFQSNNFLSIINSVTIEPYTIHDISESNSSGGGRRTDKIREMTKTELEEIISEIQDVNMNNYFVDKNKTCFYNLNDYSGPKYLFCIDQNKIVTYIRTDGPDTRSWYVPEYENINRSVIINSITNLQNCKIDSDCTLEGVGVCIPKESPCKSNSVNCDSGYRLAINNKYSFVWDGLNYNEDQCIVNNVWGSYEKHEYYKTSCEANICKTSIIQGN